MLAREVEFVHRCGVQGLTWPQLASEYATLTFDERTAGAETIVRAARRLDPGTRLAVVISVQAADIDTAVEYARPADAIGPDAIIVIPLDGGRDERRQEEY